MKIVKPLAFLGLAAIAISGYAAQFQLTITNTGPQPLSPLFFAASNDQFNIFSIGTTASTGIKNVAERGDASLLASYAAAAGVNVGYSSILGSTPLIPGQTRTTTFSTDAEHPYFSFAAMLGKTNDGFIGESVNSLGLSLFELGSPKGLRIDVYGSRAWDAGTKMNTQNAADLAFLGGTGEPPELDPFSVIRAHGGVISGVGDSWQLMPNWTPRTKLATITVIRVGQTESEARP